MTDIKICTIDESDNWYPDTHADLPHYTDLCYDSYHIKIFEQLVLDEYADSLDQSVVRKNLITQSDWSLVGECIEQHSLDINELNERVEWATNLPDRYTKDIMDDSSWDGAAFDAKLKVDSCLQSEGF